MKKILLIATGGTIASKKIEPKNYPEHKIVIKNNASLMIEKKEERTGLAPAIDSEELLKYIPEVREWCKIDAIQLLNIDSSNIQPEDWLSIEKEIEEQYQNYDGFVITHGTDTMAYTAAMLSYLIQNADKPIVITGAQKPINLDITDAKMNLRDAFRFACFGNQGVHIIFNGKAILGTRGRKVKTKSYDAFQSINYPYAAYIDGKRVTKYIRDGLTDQSVSFYDKLFPNVFLLKLSPGMKPDVLDYISDEYEAIVIESYGTGGIPFADERNFLKGVERASEKGKIIVVATQVMLEGSDLGVYEVGAKALKHPILQSYDMTIEATITKLMWILAQTKDFEKVKEMFYKNIHEDILYSNEDSDI